MAVRSLNVNSSGSRRLDAAMPGTSARNRLNSAAIARPPGTFESRAAPRSQVATSSISLSTSPSWEWMSWPAISEMNF